jgi:hypothetical protein
MTGAHMDDTTWKQLCQAIMKEQDPKKLLSLVDELNRELELRERQSRHRNHPGAAHTPE